MNISIVGIDIAKNVFQLHGVNETGKAVIKKECPVPNLAGTWPIYQPTR
jgi:hypothetical protein